jgi:hypothetical protein
LRKWTLGGWAESGGGGGGTVEGMAERDGGGCEREVEEGGEVEGSVDLKRIPSVRHAAFEGAGEEGDEGVATKLVAVADELAERLRRAAQGCLCVRLAWGWLRQCHRLEQEESCQTAGPRGGGAHERRGRACFRFGPLTDKWRW